MPPVPWSKDINFASALLLHSCITVLIKEILNRGGLAYRLLSRQMKRSRDNTNIKTSAILDAYTSVCSNHNNGDMAELYFTNTGFGLLAVSLATSVAMNSLLPAIALNMIVAGTFVMTFIASLAVGHDKYTLPFMALRRAGRFIWSDTPFVNFFSLIYNATVLKGRSTLRLQDYVTFRSIAVFELLFMKAKLASATVETQITLMRRLLATERVILNAQVKIPFSSMNLSTLPRKDIKAFTTSQRLAVMFGKTSIDYDFGGVAGALGPAKLPTPAIGANIERRTLGWKLYRQSEDVVILADCFAETKPQDALARFLKHTHGILLRRLGKKRVVYLIRDPLGRAGLLNTWRSNVNLVTGVSIRWLDETFKDRETAEDLVVT